jgi:hypothetical protein
MDKERFEFELWHSVREAATYLHYLDHFRDAKRNIEPIYRGVLALVSVISSIVSFLEVPVLIKGASLLTALLAMAPLVFPIIPKSEDFSKMGELRKATYDWLRILEKFWYGEWTEQAYAGYSKKKMEFGKTDNDLSELFGEVDPKLTEKAHQYANRYLDKYFTSSSE